MCIRLLTGIAGVGLLAASMVWAEQPKQKPAMSQDMKEAIAFERHKDRADARQARKEAIHPSVSYTNAYHSEADRSADEPGRHIVKDPGEPSTRHDRR